MPKIYVIQKQMTLHPTTGELTPKYDMTSALCYGEPVYLLSPTAGPFNSESIILELKEKLAAYNPEEDFLLLVGNPCLIGWACAVAAKRGGGLNLLQWSSKFKKYVPIRSAI